jgi:YVTN family beta-propeller protein
MPCIAVSLLLVLFLAACSSGGNGSGSGGTTTVSVAVNPPGAILQLNQTLQLSATVSGAPNLTIAAGNGAVRTNNVVTITTTVPHGFAVGQIVTLNGVTDSSFLGTFGITAVPSPTTFTFSQTAANATSGGGTIPHTAVKWQVNGTEGGTASAGLISTNGLYTAPAILIPATTATINAGGAVRASNVVTITTAAAHSFTVGQIISITGVTVLPPATATITATGAARAANTVTVTTSAAHNFIAGQIVTITGVTDASFNGAFLILSVPSTTTFTFSQVASDATSGGGTASVPVTNFDGTFQVATVPSSTTFTYTQVGANATSGSGQVSSAAVQIKAISVADSTASGTASIVLDSGISLAITPPAASVATGDIVQFTVTNSGPTTTTLNWFVNDVAGGNATFGTVSSTGLYTAPAAVPAPATVTVKAQAVADLTKTVTAQVSIAIGTTPTLTAMWPTIVAQGSAFHDFFLVGSNFLTTTVVRVNGVAVPGSPTAVSATLLRVRVPESFFASAGTFPVVIAAQGGGASAPLNLTITPERPGLIGTAPDSVTQGTPTITAQFNGGYYSPSVNAEFDGGVRAATINNSRQLDVALSAADLSTAGLFSVGVRNPTAPAPLAAVNIAVQPTAAASVLATVCTLGGSPGSCTAGAAPSAVAINPATGIAVVANRAAGSVTRIDLATNTPVGAPIAVGGAASSAPTGVAVDFARNIAVVANNGTDNISIVDLASGTVTATIPSPTTVGGTGPLKPVSVAVHSALGLAIVANASTNSATIIHLATNTVLAVTTGVSTGANPQVALEPRLNWAVVTPGGAGATTIVDLGRQSAITASGAVRASNVVTITTAAPHGIQINDQVTISGVADASFNGLVTVTGAPSSTTFTYAQTGGSVTSGGGLVSHPGFLASITLGLNMRGVSVNPETHTAFLIDPTAGNAVSFSLIDQTVRTGASASGFFATAVNPLTNVGMAANPGTNTVQVFDLRQPAALGSALTVGTAPRAVAIDAGSNTAVVANETSNDVTIVSLGAIRSPHILQSAPLSTISSGSNLTLTVIGFGLTGGTVRLDGTAVATAVVSGRQLTATVPAGMLAAARRYNVDVQTAGGTSNVSELTVIQPVNVGSLPSAVAIDPERDVAVVTNSGSNNVSLVNMSTGAVTATVSVGTSPQGVAVISRLGRAVVTNFGSNNASILDLAAGTVAATIGVGSGPLGVAIDPNDSQVLVANSASNTVSLFLADAAGGTASTTTVESRPTAIAIDPAQRMAVVTHTTQNSAVLLSLPTGAQAGRFTGLSQPNGAVYDPDSNRFVIISSLSNNLTLVNPLTFGGQTVRLGINPTSVAYNRHSSTLVTVNTASKTMSVMDFRGLRVREVLSIMGSPLFGVDIHPRTNVAVVVDQANNRVLLVPLPR